MKTIILDTESNGMKPEQICQLSYIICEDGEVRGRNFYFSVDCMNDYALKKHRLSKQKLYGLSRGERFKDRAELFYRDLSSADMVCGHNIASDMRVIDIELNRLALYTPQIRWFDTMKHYDNAMHLVGKTGQHKPPRLDELWRYFRIPEERIDRAVAQIFGPSHTMAHDARFDATATYLCIYEAQQRGDIRGVI